MCHVRGNLYLNLVAIDDAIDHSGDEGSIILEQTKIQFQRVKHLEGDVVMLFFVLYRVFKSMEPLSFDIPP